MFHLYIKDPVDIPMTEAKVNVFVQYHLLQKESSHFTNENRKD